MTGRAGGREWIMGGFWEDYPEEKRTAAET